MMNAECSIADRVRASILEALLDGEEWPVGELFAFCQKRDLEELNRNTFYSIMSRMERNTPRLVKKKKGVYQYLLSEPAQRIKEPRPAVPLDEQPPRELTEEEIIGIWRSAAQRIAQGLKQPDYEMSTGEFARYKRMNEINKRMLALLSDYL
jgi:hypothetical protein